MNDHTNSLAALAISMILAGQSKLGKSWLALQAAVAVDTGAHVLDRSTTRGRQIPCSLTDGKSALSPHKSAARVRRRGSHNHNNGHHMGTMI